MPLQRRRRRINKICPCLRRHIAPSSAVDIKIIKFKSGISRSIYFKCQTHGISNTQTNCGERQFYPFVVSLKGYSIYKKKRISVGLIGHNTIDNIYIACIMSLKSEINTVTWQIHRWQGHNIIVTIVHKKAQQIIVNPSIATALTAHYPAAGKCRTRISPKIVIPRHPDGITLLRRDSYRYPQCHQETEYKNNSLHITPLPCTFAYNNIHKSLWDNIVMHKQYYNLHLQIYI